MRTLFSFRGVNKIRLRSEKKYSANYKANKKRNKKRIVLVPSIRDKKERIGMGKEMVRALSKE